MNDHISESIASSEALAASLRALVNTVRKEHPSPPSLTTPRLVALLSPDFIVPTPEESNLLDRLEHLIDRRIFEALSNHVTSSADIPELVKQQVKELEDAYWFERMVKRMFDARMESVADELVDDRSFLNAVSTELDSNLDESIRDAIKAEYQSGDFDTRVEEYILDNLDKLLDQLDEDALDKIANAVLSRIELRLRNSSFPTAPTT